MSPAKSKPEERRVGAVRPSQLMFTYGIGSLVDLPNISVVVGGLDRWTREQAPIKEPRLLEAVQGILGRQVRELRAAPMLEDTGRPFDDWAKQGVPAYPFPRWLRCSDPKCNLLAPVDSGLFQFESNSFATNRARYIHVGCAGNNSKRTAIPTRFVVACAGGHLDDFPFIEFCHDYQPCTGDPVLELRDVALAARATDQRVRCRTCGKEAGIQRAFGFGALKMLPMCRGRHPHLPKYESCDRRTTAMLVGATNLWFPITRNVLSLPDVVAPIDAAVSDHWADLESVTVVGDLASLKRFNRTVAEILEPFSDEDVFAAIERYRNAEEVTNEPDLHGPEWRVFTGPPVNLDDLTTRHAGIPNGFAGRLSGTVIADRLRTVTAFCGFTRIDSLDEAELSDLKIRRAPISHNDASWVPAAEARGEGLLVRLDEDAVQAWEKDATEHPRILEVQASVRAWRKRRHLPIDRGIPTPRFILVHTFAHMLLHQMALDCGYNTASLQERVYARGSQEDQPMAGVLIYTSDSDSEGTLGGLVSLGDADNMGRLILEGLHRATLCSGDPLCAEHRADVETGTSLHGASCHSCLFLPETSCGHGNRALDRSMLVRTLASSDLAFFTLP